MLSNTALATVLGLAALSTAMPAARVDYIPCRQPPPGQVICSGPDHFGLCNADGFVTFQPVAAGMTCKDGYYVGADQQMSQPVASAQPTLPAVSTSGAAAPTATPLTTIDVQPAVSGSPTSTTSAAGACTSMPGTVRDTECPNGFVTEV